MKLTPHITEKTLESAKTGKYTFLVGPNLTKKEIASLVTETFGVKVKNVATVNYKSRIKRNMRGRFQTIKAYKKAIITLVGKDVIDLFDTKEK